MLVSGRVGAGFNFFVIFDPENLGKMIHFDEHIVQMGWFNHQLEQGTFLVCLDFFFNTNKNRQMNLENTCSKGVEVLVLPALFSLEVGVWSCRPTWMAAQKSCCFMNFRLISKS